MAKDIIVGIAIGATMQAGVGTVFGRTTKYLAGLGGAIQANERRAGRIEAYRTLETRLGKVFPARAGMNRTGATARPPDVRVPRASGDEPGAATSPLILHECSPRERG